MPGTTITAAPGCGLRAAFGCLTPRQLEVLALMAEGHSNAAIAGRLVISAKAVVQHTSQIYERLDIAPDDATHRRVVAVVRYLSHAPTVSRLVAAAN